tara:strand:- start:60 stop:725 length:666 start_codon:yes stop_codon:yes gene_type:complete
MAKTKKSGKEKKKPVKKSKDSKKLKILAAGDLHGDMDVARRLAARAKKEKVDLVVLAGDLHGMFKSEGEIIEPFKKAHQRVVFVPGNWDTSLEVDILKKVHKIRDIDGYYVNYGGVDIVGVGNKDFELEPNEKDISAKLKKNFDKIKTKSGKKILVSHLHAAGSKAEFSGIPGSKSLRKAIDYFHPDILLQGHIHEAEGIEEKIGKTKVITVGRRGKIIEV